MHAMQSVNTSAPFEYSHTASGAEDYNDPLLTGYTAPQPQKRGSEIILVVVGMLLPLLAQIGHAHAHGG
jgi:zinc transporter 9